MIRWMDSKARRLDRTSLGVAASALLVLVVSAGLFAQAQAPAPASERVLLTAARSTVINTDFDITRIAVTDPAIADATVVEPREILIDGKAPGTVSLFVWGVGQRKQYDVVVDRGIPVLQQQLRALFPGEDINVSLADEAIILSGHVSNNNVMFRAAEITEATSSKARVINLLELPGGMESQQVLLQVRIAEVNRRALSEMGASFFTGPGGAKDGIGRITTQQFGAPDFTPLTGVQGDVKAISMTFSDFLNLFIFDRAHDVGALIRALQSRGLFQSLAEPNLIAYNGQEASFLAGGEFPIPVVQGAAGGVTITFKEYGVRLNFRPMIAGDVIRLRVRPEVSSLDFAAGISLQGFRVPALITRRAETDVELRDGQSFAIAGLLDNTSQEDTSKVPLLGDIPIIGTLFKARANRAERTELMVLVTPRLVRPLNPDEVPPLPTNPERFLPSVEGTQGPPTGAGLIDGPPPARAP